MQMTISFEAVYTHTLSLVYNKIEINKDSFRTRIIACGF